MQQRLRRERVAIREAVRDVKRKAELHVWLADDRLRLFIERLAQAAAIGLDETAWRRHEFPNCGMCEIDWPENAPLATRRRWRLPEETAWHHT